MCAPILLEGYDVATRYDCNRNYDYSYNVKSDVDNSLLEK